MKKLLNLLCAGVLGGILCVGFVACNEPVGQGQSEEEAGIRPVSVSNEVAEKIWQIARFVSVPSDGRDDSFFDGCVMINSVDELPKTDLQGNPLDLSVIDLDAHTLVVGQWVQGNGGIFLASQNVVVQDSVATLNLNLGLLRNGDLWAQKTDVQWFCCLYPKIEAETIRMNVIKDY